MIQIGRQQRKEDYASTTYLSLPLSLWLALSTISLATHCSVASLELQLALWQVCTLLAWSFAVYQSLMLVISSI